MEMWQRVQTWTSCKLPQGLTVSWRVLNDCIHHGITLPEVTPRDASTVWPISVGTEGNKMTSTLLDPLWPYHSTTSESFTCDLPDYSRCPPFSLSPFSLFFSRSLSLILIKKRGRMCCNGHTIIAALKKAPRGNDNTQCQEWKLDYTEPLLVIHHHHQLMHNDNEQK